MSEPRKPLPVFRRERLVLWALMALVMFGYVYYQRQTGQHGAPRQVVERETTPRPTTTTSAGTKTTASKPAASSSASLPVPKPSAAKPAANLIVRNVVLRDQDDEVIYRGDIDLEPTLARVAAGRKLRFANDGTTFQNRERRLPQKPAGYYREWVVPTPGESGPGPQRLVTGDDGEVWYTKDHYRSFQRIAAKLPVAAGAGER